MIPIENGTKLQLAIDNGPGNPIKFEMIATYKETLDDSSFLMSVPMQDGHPAVIDENTKLLLQYSIGSEVMTIAAYKDDEIKQGVRRSWKMRRVSEQRQFMQRADERYKVALHCEYWQETWPVKEGKIIHEDALSLDISAGGLAVYLALRFEVGEMLKFTLPRVGMQEEGAERDVVAVVCWLREAPKGSPFRNVVGLQFKFADDADKDVMRQYVGNLKRTYNL